MLAIVLMLLCSRSGMYAGRRDGSLDVRLRAAGPPELFRGELFLDRRVLVNLVLGCLVAAPVQPHLGGEDDVERGDDGHDFVATVLGVTREIASGIMSV